MKRNIEYPKTIKKMISSQDKKKPFLKYNKTFKAFLWIISLAIIVGVIVLGLFLGGAI